MIVVVRYENVLIEEGTLGQIFDLIESNRLLLGIVDYTISQPSLEQVFLQFARKQIPENSSDGEHNISCDESAGSEDDSNPLGDVPLERSYL